jgi:hypothetical protein
MQTIAEVGTFTFKQFNNFTRDFINTEGMLLINSEQHRKLKFKIKE